LLDNASLPIVYDATIKRSTIDPFNDPEEEEKLPPITLNSTQLEVMENPSKLPIPAER
jgi:hypothetical protein